MMENILEVRNLVKKFPGFTLDNINIELPQGVIMGFIDCNPFKTVLDGAVFMTQSPRYTDAP